MTVDLPRPDPLRPKSFRRFLARAERRTRRRNGSGSGYSIAVLVLFYAPSVVAGAVFELDGPPPAHPLLSGPAGLAALVAALAVACAAWSYLGPIPVPPPWATWVLSTPLDRGILLAHRAWARLAIALLPGVALGAAAAAAAGLRDAAAAAAVVVGATGGVAACAAAILRQRGIRARWWTPWVLTAAGGIAAASLTVARTEPIPVLWWWVAAAAAGCLAALTSAVALARVRHIPPGRLVSAGHTSSGIFMALTELSLDWVGRGDRHGRRPSARARPLTGIGQAALAAVCWRRLRRDAIALARFAVTIVVLYPLGSIGHGIGGMRAALAAIAVIAATVAISGIASTARRFQRDPQLPAHLGLDPRLSRRTALTVPAVLTVLWAVLAAPAMAIGGSVAMAAVCAALGYAVVAFRLTREEFAPSYAMGQQYSTDLVRRATRGPAQLVAACLLAAVVAAAV